MLTFQDILPEDGGYFQFMRETVEPYLCSYRKEGFFSSKDEKKLYYECEILPSAKGAVVISHGYNESAEKFREMAYWFMQMGFSVFTLDHRGHGRSHRLSPDLALTDIESFSDYVRDLHCFVKKIVQPNTVGLPLYLYGHSMGGAVSILYLQNHPSVFRKAILTAPMLKPKTEGIPTPVTRAMSAVCRVFGKGDKLVFTAKAGFNDNEQFESSPDTSKERFEYYRQKRVAYPYLQNSYPTYRWVNESLRIGKYMLDPIRVARVKIPVLLFSAGEDDFVFRREQEIFISLLENGELYYEDRARHEIYMSTNDVMADYLSEIETFLKRATQKKQK